MRNMKRIKQFNWRFQLLNRAIYLYPFWWKWDGVHNFGFISVVC